MHKSLHIHSTMLQKPLSFYDQHWSSIHLMGIKSMYSVLFQIFVIRLMCLDDVNKSPWHEDLLKLIIVKAVVGWLWL